MKSINCEVHTSTKGSLSNYEDDDNDSVKKQMVL